MNINEIRIGSKIKLPTLAGYNSEEIRALTVSWIHPDKNFIRVTIDDLGFTECILVNSTTGFIG